MTNNMDHLRMCRACLVGDESLTSLKMSGLEDIFVLLLGSKLTESQTTHWLCVKCIHTLQKISSFRDLCIKTDGVLREYYISYSEGDKEGIEFLQSQRQMLYVCDTRQDNLKIWNVELKPQIKEEIMDEPSPTNSNSPIATNYLPEDNLETNSYDEKDMKIFASNLKPCTDISTTQLSTSPTLCEKDIKKIASHSKTLIDNPSTQLSNSPTDGDIASKLKIHTNKSAYQLSNNFKRVKPVNFDMINEMFNTDDFEHWKAANLKHLIGKGEPDKNMMVTEILNTEDEIAEDRLIKEKNPKYVDSCFKCQSCIYGFKYAFALDNHMKRHYPERGPEKCNLCDQYYSNVSKLRKHIIWNHRLRIRCAVCGYRVRDSPRALFHARMHKGEKYSCQICQAKFKNPFNLKVHTTSFHEKKITCAVCNKHFGSNELLQEHLEVAHTFSKELKCNVCEKVLKTRDCLLKHFENHRSTKKYYCVECNKYFSRYRSLQDHLTKTKAHIDISSLKFSCDKCSKKYSNPKELKLHIESVHEGTKRFKCLECENTYLSVIALRKHVREIHRGYKAPKNHCCHVCNKTFTTKSLIKNHLRVHTGEKPFSCSQCEWRFKQKAALNTHIKLVHLKMTQNVKNKPDKNVTVK